jgi:membrane associated rhomboid family serine protease
MSRPFTWIASAIFAIMALIHVYRLLTHFQIVFGSHTIPQWASVVGFIVAALLSWMLCREARGTRGA